MCEEKIFQQHTELETYLVKIENWVLMNISSIVDDRLSREKCLEVLLLFSIDLADWMYSLLKHVLMCMQSRDSVFSARVLLVLTVPHPCTAVGVSVHYDGTSVEWQCKHNLSIKPGKCSFPD